MKTIRLIVKADDSTDLQGGGHVHTTWNTIEAEVSDADYKRLTDATWVKKQVVGIEWIPRIGEA